MTVTLRIVGLRAVAQALQTGDATPSGKETVPGVIPSPPAVGALPIGGREHMAAIIPDQPMQPGAPLA